MAAAFDRFVLELARRERNDDAWAMPSAASAAKRMETVSDAELAERLRHGDPTALEMLAYRYLPQLGTLAFAILGSNDAAQDVVQDALFLLWEQRARLDRENNVAGYLYRTVRNRALSMLRHERAESRATQRIEHEGDTTSNTAEQQLDTADVKTRVYAALRHVPPGQREVFLLYWEHDLTYAEIATALEISIANVRQQMHRATRRLAQHLLD